jgi:hypothetical protein
VGERLRAAVGFAVPFDVLRRATSSPCARRLTWLERLQILLVTATEVVAITRATLVGWAVRARTARHPASARREHWC